MVADGALAQSISAGCACADSATTANYHNITSGLQADMLMHLKEQERLQGI